MNNISLAELNPKGFPLTSELTANLIEHHRRVNIVRTRYGKPMYCTRGVSDVADQRRIYLEKAKRAGIPILTVRIPMGSCHLKAAASDWRDASRDLYNWLQANPEVLEEANMWAELDTDGWVHLQSFPFGSYKPGGTRWFRA